MKARILNIGRFELLHNIRMLNSSAWKLNSWHLQRLWLSMRRGSRVGIMAIELASACQACQGFNSRCPQSNIQCAGSVSVAGFLSTPKEVSHTWFSLHLKHKQGPIRSGCFPSTIRATRLASMSKTMSCNCNNSHLVLPKVKMWVLLGLFAGYF